MKKTILLIDDDIYTRQAIAGSLSNEFTVLEASKYSEAVKYFNQTLNLAVIDYSLPEMNGLEILTAIREKYPEIPAIMITAFSTEDIAIEAIRSGASDYMRKPFGLKEIRERIFRLLYGKNDLNRTSQLTDWKDFKMDSIAFYIEKHYRDSDLTLNNVARMAYMNKTTFCKAFKERFGRSFVSYLNEIRIQRANELLKKDLTVKEIAFFLGFRSTEYFGRVFRKINGISPSEYRRKSKVLEKNNSQYSYSQRKYHREYAAGNERQHKRIPIAASARLTYMSSEGHKSVDCTVASISLPGVSVYSDCMLGKGKTVSIEIHFISTDGQMKTDTIEGRIINSNEVANLCYTCIVFNEEINQQKQPFLHEHICKLISIDDDLVLKGGY